MSLGKKIIALFLVLGFSFSVGSYVALKLSVLPAFEDVERESSAAALSRAQQQLAGDLRALEILSKEYAFWDHTYAYVEGKRPDFPEDNLDQGTWQSIDIDMLLVFDAQGNQLYGWLAHPANDRLLPLADEIERPLAPGHPLVTHQTMSHSVKGFLRARSGLMQVVSHPILTNAAEGPIAGSLVVGQFVTQARVLELGRRATTDFALHATDAGKAPPWIALASDAVQVEFDEKSARAYRLVRDVLDQPVAVMEVKTPRTITQIGTGVIRTAAVLLASASAVFLLAAWLFLQRLIVVPVKRLTHKILAIRRTGNLLIDSEAKRSDEIGVLAGEFGELTLQLGQVQTKLEEARDEALAMSRAKSEFLARMSHEIRTPMNGVLGMTELLGDTALNKKQRRFAKTIYASAGSLLNIINDVLDFSKMEADKLRLELVDVHLRAVVEETVEGLASQAHGKGLELMTMVPPDLHTTVRVDPIRLRQVLTNLVGNAIKFTEQGEVVVGVTTTEVDAEHLDVHFEITDTGIGIESHRQREIFESFAQEDGSTTRLFGGTGLGLAISRELVDLMGGELTVKSTRGVGSTFSFVLRTQIGGDDAPSASGRMQYLAGQRVLVVDDNATNREILQHQLRSWRAHTDSAESAARALELLASGAAAGAPYDLAILDMHMPRSDGLQLTRKIRDNPAFARLKLVILSSVAAPAAENVMRDLDIAGQLTKPVRQAQLYDSLVAVMGGDTVSESHPRSTCATAKTLTGRVLLAEDNPVNQAVAIGMLEMLGPTVELAANGQEAVAKATAEPFDLLLMDCQMPVMDGLEAVARIRRMEADAGRLRTPIVAVTANALKGDRERCLAVGMDDYLTKPFSSEQLHAILVRFLPSGAGAALGNASDDVDSPIDKSVFDFLSRLQQPGAPNIRQKVINIYLETSRVLKDRLGAAIDSANAARVWESAHALKSSSANVGAVALADLCRRLETMGREENLAGGPTLQQRLESEYERVVVALEVEARSATA